MWRWDQAEPFGNSPANDDPDGNSVAFDLPLRLPGQRYDAETGLHYNYFRDYDPGIGRYSQSDPMGLESGPNTYAFVEGSPLTDSDLYGLITGTSKGFRRVNCPQAERDECIERCKRQGREMVSCMVTRGRRTVVRNGVAIPELYTVPGSMSCKCTDCEEDSTVKKIWDWLTKPRFRDDSPLDPYTGGGAKPRDPFGVPPVWRPLPVP